ncbi:hypothetical protein [Mesorhizobium huakuii]|uniref:DUF3396 domain-containing protein n=1 Tax=Mesorhizobium huakuii TaxID=28104 RepID=A0A7G6SYK5_9HYPH|nr:hypothetical protein [Mesorhizobium huakuii]QND59587.1 hypothetical protein HB778_25715 [Mesorhizobium huakuii]
MKAPRIWITHLSVAPWTSAQTWDTYLRRAETTLGDRLIRLDHRDPVRRVADSRNGEGEFIVEFEKNHNSRWVAGKFEKSGVTLNIHFHKGPFDQYARPTHNSITLVLPQKTDRSTIRDLFALGNSHLTPFYSYSDLQPVMTEKGNRHQRLTPGFDIERELVGVFWLTYFGPAYTRFFGAERLLDLYGTQMSDNGGVTLCLGEAPGLLTTEREQAERDLGAQSFAGHGVLKRQGEFALTLAALRGQWEGKK